MRQKSLIIAFLIISLLINQGSCPFEPSLLSFDIDWTDQGFQEIDTTGYILQGITSGGVYTHYGVAACNPHFGELAVIYTLDGHYLGTFEVIDTGSNSKLVSGESIDVWMPNMEVAKAWMSITRGRVYCKFIAGKG